MNPEIEAMLGKSPRPWIWTVLTLGSVVLTVYFQSVIVGVVAGLCFGWYFGNYQGRLAVVAAWRRDVEIQFDQLEETRDVIR